MNTFSSNIEPIARAICENSAHALWNGEPERLASHVERCWHCVAAELEAGLIDETGALLPDANYEAGVAAYRDWRARHPDYVVPPNNVD